MPKIRTKPYRARDRITFQIPTEPPKYLLKWLNSQKFVSPSIIEVLSQHAEKVYGKEGFEK